MTHLMPNLEEWEATELRTECNHYFLPTFWRTPPEVRQNRVFFSNVRFHSGGSARADDSFVCSGCIFCCGLSFVTDSVVPEGGGCRTRRVPFPPRCFGVGMDPSRRDGIESCG